jgi:hypothetical protein
MVPEDAAALLGAMLGSHAGSDTVDVVLNLKGLPGLFRGNRRTERWSSMRISEFGLGQDAGRNAIQGIAELLRFFAAEEEDRIRYELAERHLEHGFYAVVELERLGSFASLTLGVQGLFSHGWTYGRRGSCRVEQVRRIRHEALREVAANFR